MSYSFIDYIEDYYIPIMKLDKTVKPVASFLVAIKEEGSPRFRETYIELIDYMKDIDSKDLFNIHFNRMRQTIEAAKSINLERQQF
jgi:hypothetical protein